MLNVYLVLFRLDKQQYALPLEQVERAVRMVAIARLPDAGQGLLGAINYGGKSLPVFNLRERFGLPPRPPGLDDRLLIVHPPKIALVVAEVLDVLPGEQLAPTGERLAASDSSPVAAVLQAQDGQLVFLLDLGRLFPEAAYAG